MTSVDPEKANVNWPTLSNEITTFIDAGEIDKALKVLDATKTSFTSNRHARYKFDELYGRIITKIVESNGTDGVKKAMELAEKTFVKNIIPNTIVKTLIKKATDNKNKERLKESLKVIQSLPDSSSRYSLFNEVIEAYQRLGDDENAIQVALHTDETSNHLFQIIRFRINHGDLDSAEELIRKCSNNLSISLTQLALTRLMEAYLDMNEKYIKAGNVMGAAGAIDKLCIFFSNNVATLDNVLLQTSEQLRDSYNKWGDVNLLKLAWTAKEKIQDPDVRNKAVLPGLPPEAPPPPFPKI